MRALSRREFGVALVAAVPLARTRRLGADACPIGVTTAAFKDLPRVSGRDNVDDIVRALGAVGALHVELALQNVEPAPPSTAPVMGGSAAYPRRIVLTLEEIAATNGEARAALRAWRLRTPPGVFEAVRQRFARAGLVMHACAIRYDDTFTDDEIEATFRQVRALGVSTVSSPLTLPVARRLVPFAERHHVTVAIHNQADGSGSGAIDSEQLAGALAMSPTFALKLDVGNLTASNLDAVAVLRRHLDRVALVLLTDRLRNRGASQPFGEGDTPIADVVAVLAASAPSIPALVGYDYVGLRSAADEVRTSLRYVTRLLSDRARGSQDAVAGPARAGRA